MTKTMDRIDSMPIRTRGLILVGVITVVLVGMAGLEHMKRVTGAEIVLNAQPVDPRDLLRGAYVTLDYEAERITTNELQRQSDLGDLAKGDKVYVSLKKNEFGTWTPVAVTREKQQAVAGETIVRASVVSAYDVEPDLPGDHLKSLNLEIGADRYFADEASAKALENANRDGDLKVVLAVGRGGDPVIKALIVNGKRRDESFF